MFYGKWHVSERHIAIKDVAQSLSKMRMRLQLTALDFQRTRRLLGSDTASNGSRSARERVAKLGAQARGTHASTARDGRDRSSRGGGVSKYGSRHVSSLENTGMGPEYSSVVADAIPIRASVLELALSIRFRLWLRTRRRGSLGAKGRWPCVTALLRTSPHLTQ